MENESPYVGKTRVKTKVKTGLSQKTKQKNINFSKQIEELKKEVIMPNLNIALSLVGYGFQDGYGEGEFEDMPHFAIGVMNKHKRWVCYMLFEDEIPSEEDIKKALSDCDQRFREYRVPLTKKARQKVRKVLFVYRPKTMQNVEVNADNVF